MNKNIAFAFIALILVQISVNQGTPTCPDGQVYNAGINAAKCTSCPVSIKTCQNAVTYHQRIVGFGNPSGSGNVPYCPAGTSVYNKNNNNCEQYCKQGCASCLVDFDFCTNCEPGFTWNNDYTCIPAVIGLEAASLALLVIGLVFAVIGCCTVIRAKKN